MENPVVVVLDVGNDGGGVGWRRMATFLDLRGRICKRLLLPHSDHDGVLLLPNQRSDDDDFRRSRFVQNTSS